MQSLYYQPLYIQMHYLCNWWVNKPRAYLARYIATPNNELFRFLELTQKTGLKPLIVEFLQDKFYRNNVDKLCLARMRFCKGMQKADAIKSVKVMDFRRLQLKRFTDLRTLWGESLADFHHRLLSHSVSAVDLYDISPWYKSHGERANEYYKYFLALFICHGILFENFITNEEEEHFSKTVVMPAYREVVSRFGVKPLIVQLLPPEIAGDDYWRSYPEELLEEVNKCLAKKSSQALCS